MGDFEFGIINYSQLHTPYCRFPTPKLAYDIIRRKKNITGNTQ